MKKERVFFKKIHVYLFSAIALDQGFFLLLGTLNS